MTQNQNSSAATERAKAIVKESWRQTCAGPGEFDDYAVGLIAAAITGDVAQPRQEPLWHRVQDQIDAWAQETLGEDAGVIMSWSDRLAQHLAPELAAQPPAAPVETATKSAPALAAPHNTGERPPSSDAAEAGAGTRCSADNAADQIEDLRRRIVAHERLHARIAQAIGCETWQGDLADAVRETLAKSGNVVGWRAAEDTYRNEGDEHFTAGINVPITNALGDADFHFHSIQVYGRTKEEAEARRDFVLQQIDNKANLLRCLKASIDTRINDLLVETKPGYDDSLVGINEAWDVVRKACEEYLGKVTR